jgi:hypothetical protein
MSGLFVYRRNDAPRHTPDQLAAALTAAGAACRVERLADGLWLVLAGGRTDGGLTVGDDGTADSLMLRPGDDPPGVLDTLFAGLERLGWEVADDG